MHIYIYCTSLFFVQLLSRVRLFATLWTAECQAPLTSIVFWSLLKFMSTESVILSNHLILPSSPFCLQSFPALASFPMRRLFTSSGQSIGSILCFKWISWESLGLQGDQTNPKGYQPWIFIGRTDAEAEAPILWDELTRLQCFLCNTWLKWVALRWGRSFESEGRGIWLLPTIHSSDEAGHYPFPTVGLSWSPWEIWKWGSRSYARKWR